mmetsp:Transcript_3026/g.7018  ORF Transcript_3026/g.7018 Transcript_3026/m.7018 type:complete len:206 (+) Transcript_3026:610-1227(+)
MVCRSPSSFFSCSNLIFSLCIAMIAASLSFFSFSFSLIVFCSSVYRSSSISFRTFVFSKSVSLRFRFSTRSACASFFSTSFILRMLPSTSAMRFFTSSVLAVLSAFSSAKWVSSSEKRISVDWSALASTSVVAMVRSSCSMMSSRFFLLSSCSSVTNRSEFVCCSTTFSVASNSCARWFSPPTAENNKWASRIINTSLLTMLAPC